MYNSHQIPKDTIYAIFSNLTELLDFQCRFLVSLEGSVSLGFNEHRVGALFISNAEGFDLYIRICGNFAHAMQTANIHQELLSKISKVDPIRQLQSLLILPIQRICRYPLLLRELVKLSSPDNYGYCEELTESLDIIKLATDKVNEAQRMGENAIIKKSLLTKIVDWKVNLILY